MLLVTSYFTNHRRYWSFQIVQTHFFLDKWFDAETYTTVLKHRCHHLSQITFSSIFVYWILILTLVVLKYHIAVLAKSPFQLLLFSCNSSEAFCAVLIQLFKWENARQFWSTTVAVFSTLFTSTIFASTVLKHHCHRLSQIAVLSIIVYWILMLNIDVLKYHHRRFSRISVSFIICIVSLVLMLCAKCWFNCSIKKNARQAKFWFNCSIKKNVRQFWSTTVAVLATSPLLFHHFHDHVFYLWFWSLRYWSVIAVLAKSPFFYHLL